MTGWYALAKLGDDAFIGDREFGRLHAYPGPGEKHDADGDGKQDHFRREQVPNRLIATTPAS